MKMLAGPPAAKTRSILAGTSTLRPAESTTVRLSAASKDDPIRDVTMNAKVAIQIFPKRPIPNPFHIMSDTIMAYGRSCLLSVVPNLRYFIKRFDRLSE